MRFVSVGRGVFEFSRNEVYDVNKGVEVVFYIVLLVEIENEIVLEFWRVREKKENLRKRKGEIYKGVLGVVVRVESKMYVFVGEFIFFY